MALDMEESFRLEDLLGILRRRAPMVAAIAGASTLLAVFVAAVLPNEYKASATLLVEPQTISRILVEDGIAEQDINSRLHIIQMQILSRAKLSRVIDEFDVYPDLSEEMTREEVIDYMREHIELAPVIPELESEALALAGARVRDIQVNTLVLSFRHRSATKAAAVTNRLANDFIEEHLKERMRRSGDTADFIQAELTRLTEAIGSVEDEIARVKTDNAGSLPEDMTSNQRLYERTLDALRDAQGQLAEARSDAAFYGQQVQAAASGATSGGAAMTPEQRLQLLEVQLGEYRGRGFTDKHPDVIAARQELEELRARLAADGEEEDGDAALSPAQASAKAEQERAELRAASAQREVERLQEQLEKVEAKLAATPRVAEQLAALERRHDALRESYAEFSDKRQEASVAANMERGQKGEQFRVLEAAYPPPAPVSPRRPLIVVLGLMLGLVAGGGLALVQEAADGSFRSTRRLQDALRLPVLAAIPEVLLESDRVAMRRRRVRQALAATAVVVLVLGASVAGNWWVNGVPGGVQEVLGIGGEDATG